MNKGNLAIKEELDNIAIEDTIIDITQSEQIENIINEDKNIKKPNIIYTIIKKAVDVMSGIVGTILLLPIILIVWIMRLVLKENDGPLFFEQIRIGKNGKIIKLYKFRSMVINAEELIKSFTPEQMREYKENYKLTNDPRITKVGKFLRKTSLDELPQLINIINGDLSIIGPRPVVADELEKYGVNKDKFLSVTPGLTGYWAANGRSNTTYEQRMKMELYYIDNLSLKMDIKVFFKTILSVVKKEGAI